MPSGAGLLVAPQGQCLSPPPCKLKPHSKSNRDTSLTSWCFWDGDISPSLWKVKHLLLLSLASACPPKSGMVPRTWSFLLRWSSLIQPHIPRRHACERRRLEPFERLLIASKRTVNDWWLVFNGPVLTLKLSKALIKPGFHLKSTRSGRVGHLFLHTEECAFNYLRKEKEMKNSWKAGKLNHLYSFSLLEISSPYRRPGPLNSYERWLV